MKTVLCYGDSNTHGFDPATLGRYPREVRWTGQLQSLLGSDWYVIEEGLNSRTTAIDDDCYDDIKNGLTLLPAVLKTHLPVDVLILMLGSNDMKLRFGRNAADIARCVGRLVHCAQVTTAEKMGHPCEILLVSPPHIGDRVAELGCGEEFGSRCIAVSHQLAGKYRAVAQKYGVHFLDAAAVTPPSDIDCLHLSPEGHTAMARALCAACRAILEKPEN